MDALDYLRNEFGKPEGKKDVADERFFFKSTGEFESGMCAGLLLAMAVLVYIIWGITILPWTSPWTTLDATLDVRVLNEEKISQSILEPSYKEGDRCAVDIFGEFTPAVLVGTGDVLLYRQKRRGISPGTHTDQCPTGTILKDERVTIEETRAQFLQERKDLAAKKATQKELLREYGMGK